MGLILLILLALVTISIPIADGDTFFHIAVGDRILQEGFITTDPFSMHTLSYTPSEWLSDIVFALIYKTSGFTGLFVFQYIYLAAFFILLLYTMNKMAPERNRNLVFSLTAIVLFAGFATCIRPQIFTYMLAVYEIYVLEQYIKKNEKKNLVKLILIALTAANIHIGFLPMTIILTLPYMVSMLIGIHTERVKNEKNIPGALKIIFVWPLMILAACINPYGFHKLSYFTVIFDKYITGFVAEWQPPTMGSYAGLLILLMIFSTAAMLIFAKNPIRLSWCFLLGGLALMSLSSIRNYPYLILAALLVANMVMNINPNKLFRRIFIDFTPHTVILAVAIILVVGMKIYLGGYRVTAFEDFPVKAVEYLQTQNDNKVLFNEYNQGGYLIYRGITVFIDPRADLYSSSYNPGSTVLKDYIDLHTGKLHYIELMNKYNIERVLTYKGSLTDTYLSKDSGFQQEYKDEKFTIYEKMK